MTQDDRRDLALDALWAASLERSLERRGHPTRTSAPLARLRHRDLADPDHAHDSLAYWQRRRDAAANATRIPQPIARGASLTALMAVIGGPAAGVLTAGTGTAAAAVRHHDGRNGHHVKRLQRALHVTPDGIFGPRTKRALRQFQARNGLEVDGVAGPATWAAIKRAERATASASSAATRGVKRVLGHSVAELQRLLGVSADGIFGPQTLGALRAFQARAGLEVDGIAGPLTFAALQRGDRTLAGADEGDAKTVPVADKPAEKPSSAADAKITAMIAAGDRIARTPYIYGGGHGSFNSRGYDCSGSVSYVLHAAGLLASPLTSGDLASWGQAGPGKRVTIYTNAGHVWMTIDGRRFDTSAQRIAGSRWTDQMRSTSGFVVRHPAGL